MMLLAMGPRRPLDLGAWCWWLFMVAAHWSTSKAEQSKVKQQAACMITHHLSRILSQPLGHEKPIAGVLSATRRGIVRSDRHGSNGDVIQGLMELIDSLWS